LTVAIRLQTDLQEGRSKPQRRSNFDPTSPFTIEDANVGNQIAKQPLPTRLSLCVAAIGSFVPLPRRKQTREKRPNLVAL